MFTYVVYEDHILGLRYSIICDAIEEGAKILDELGPVLAQMGEE